MKQIKHLRLFIGGLWAFSSFINGAKADETPRDVPRDTPTETPRDTPSRVNESEINRITKEWPLGPKLAVQKMMAKYGAPHEFTPSMVLWKDVGPFKRIKVMQEEVFHDFPIIHTDFLEHTINFRVPTQKVSDLIKFDSSLIINRTAGELSIRCDEEDHNIMALNLAHKMVHGGFDVTQARAAMGAMIREELVGKGQITEIKLAFEPTREEHRFLDRTTLAGAPIRAEENLTNSDSEILGMLLAINRNEIKMATLAIQKNVGPDVLKFAQALRDHHGRLVTSTMRMGLNIPMEPAITKAVEKEFQRGAEHMMKILPLKEQEFEKAFMKAMIAAHQEALTLVDEDFLKNVKNDDVKNHLLKFRKYIEEHGIMARDLLKRMEENR